MFEPYTLTVGILDARSTALTGPPIDVMAKPAGL